MIITAKSTPSPRKKFSKHFFLISFLPALAYWYLEAHYPVSVAVIGGVILAIVELSLEKIFTGETHALSRFNFVLILILGTIAYIGQKGLWFKLQPFFTGLFMSGYLLWKLKTAEGILWEMLQVTGKALPPKMMILRLEKHLAFFLLFYGIFMAGLAIFASTAVWAFFKTIGLYIAFALFMVAELLSLRRIFDQYR